MKNKDSKTDKENIKKLIQKKHIIVFSAFCVIIIALFATYSIFDNYFYNKNKEVVVDEGVVISSNEANGFPVTFTSDDIICTESLSSRMIVLTKKLLTSISTTGKVEYLSEFTYVEPTMITGDKYGIIYDRASARYMMFDKNSVLYKGEAQDKNHIITSAINDSGRYVLVTKSNNSACNVNVYDKNGKCVFIWKCSDEYIVSADISSDGNDIICAGIGASDGTIYTKVYHLNVYEDKHVSEHMLEGSAVVDIKISGKDNVIASCDNGRMIIDLSVKDSKPNVVKYSSQALACDSDETGHTAVLNHKFGSFDNNQLTVYDKKNRALYNCEIKTQVSDIICKGRKVYLLTENSIIEVSNGKSEILAQTKINGKGLVVCENKLYYYSTGTLRTGK